jgi:hypothetical protein
MSLQMKSVPREWGLIDHVHKFSVEVSHLREVGQRVDRRSTGSVADLRENQ